MDKQKIIEDGMLERYILGELKSDESVLLEPMLEQNPDLRQQLEQLEEEFENLGRENGIAPPLAVRDRLVNQLNEERAPTLPINGRKSRRPWLAAASIAALFALSSGWLYVQWQNSTDQLAVISQQTTDLQQQIADMENRLATTDRRYRTVNNPNVTPLLLLGNKLSPESRALAYVNHNDKTVVVNAVGLRPLSADKTYQIWADVDGEMIDMGLLSPEADYIPLRYIDKAESLNITIEPAGGNNHPTVENLISNVYF